MAIGIPYREELLARQEQERAAGPVLNDTDAYWLPLIQAALQRGQAGPAGEHPQQGPYEQWGPARREPDQPYVPPDLKHLQELIEETERSNLSPREKELRIEQLRRIYDPYEGGKRPPFEPEYGGTIT